jgi:hypothetical protein
MDSTYTTISKEFDQPGVDRIKLFRVNLLTLFCKLDHFINTSNIYSIALKRYSLQNRVSKSTLKSFIRSTPDYYFVEQIIFLSADHLKIRQLRAPPQLV